MKQTFLGDSYDALKRLWADILRDWAPLYVERRWISKDIQRPFTRFTGIPMLPKRLGSRHSILLDPDTGIMARGRLAARHNQTHVTVDTIAEMLGEPGVRCVVTFDMSFSRRGQNEMKKARQAKLRKLQNLGCHGLYYTSHVSFLFAVSSNRRLQELHGLLRRAGIPETRVHAGQKLC